MLKDRKTDKITKKIFYKNIKGKQNYKGTILMPLRSLSKTIYTGNVLQYEVTLDQFAATPAGHKTYNLLLGNIFPNDTLKDITDKYYHWRLHSLHIAVKVMSYKSIVAYAKNDSAMTNYPYYYMQDEKDALPEMYAAFCTNPEVFADIQAIDPDTGPSQKQKLINTRILKRLKISGNIQRFHYYNSPAFKGVWEEAKTDFVPNTEIATAFLKSFVEHGYIIGLASARADLSYQQGINKMWNRRTRFDFYWPTLSHLGEQAILNSEIFAQGTDADAEVFGYQERYADYRDW